MQRHKLALAELTGLYRAGKEGAARRETSNHRRVLVPLYVRQTARGESSKPHRGGIPQQENRAALGSDEARAKRIGGQRLRERRLNATIGCSTQQTLSNLLITLRYHFTTHRQNLQQK